MAKKNYRQALETWVKNPYQFGHLLGFRKLEPIHNKFINEFIRAGAGEVRVLQAHRGSYKTTSGIVGLTLLLMLNRNLRISVTRKSQTMASKILFAMDQVFKSDIVRAWMYAAYGVMKMETDRWSSTAMRISINNRVSPEPSLQASGIGTAQTGDHFDFGWLDDIITTEDRYSEKERGATINHIYEMENIIDPNGVTLYSGTVWHPGDAWRVILPNCKNPLIYPIGTVPIQEVTPEWISKKQRRMTKGLWAANMLLRHEKDVNPVFNNPIYENLPEKADVRNFMYIDAAFGGKDSTSIWIACFHGGLRYMRKAMMLRKAIGNHWDMIENLFWGNQVQKIFYESNGAQKLIGDELNRRMLPCEEVKHTSNKYARITNTLLPVWDTIRWDESLKPPENYVFQDSDEDTAPHPMIELMEYNENAEHDDSPDGAAGMIECLDKVAGIDQVQDFIDIQTELLR